MGKSKTTKPFIDKKNASSYSLLHRSQRDVAEDVIASSAAADSHGMVLWPNPTNNPDTDEVVLGGNSVMQEWRKKLAEVGLLDNQDAEKYMKEITGSGTFLGTTGHVENPLADPRAHRHEEDTLLEVNRQMDSIPLTTEIMDEDIAAALFGDETEEEFEELNDDFVFMAASEPEGEEESFDFDRHIQQLMEKARSEREDQPISGEHGWGQRDGAFFSKLQPLHEQDEDDSIFHTPGVVSKLDPDEERALCEKFEATLAEYDSDDIGDCEVDDDSEDNDRIQADDEHFDAVLDDFLLEKEDDVLIYGKDMSRRGGSGYHNTGYAQQDAPPPIQEILAEAKQMLAEPLHAPPPEDVLIDGQSYFSLKERSQWDCESILTTYSNLDNNPVVIGTQSRRRKNKVASQPEIFKKIELSSKTGLPLGVLPGPTKDTGKDTDTFRSVNRGEARVKNETGEEKKLRKALVKQERQVARITKKVTRQVFQEEFERRAPVAADDLACKTVFRFS
jgi:protein LTV1